MISSLPSSPSRNVLQYRAQRGGIIAWRQSEEVPDTGAGTVRPRRGWVLYTRGVGRAQISYRRPGAAAGSLAATESGADTGAFNGTVSITGTLAATEIGADVGAFAGVVETGEIFASLAAVESGTDAAEFIGGAVSLSGAFAASESGSDAAAFVGEVVGAEPEIQPRTRRGHASHWVRARQRMALQTWIDYLTEEEPTESTQKVITEIKAGRPIPQTKAKGPSNISAERLAEKIIPSRLWAAQNLIADNVDVQKVVAKAIRIAQERDDEEVLMLL